MKIQGTPPQKPGASPFQPLPTQYYLKIISVGNDVANQITSQGNYQTLINDLQFFQAIKNRADFTDPQGKVYAFSQLKNDTGLDPFINALQNALPPSDGKVQMMDPNTGQNDLPLMDKNGQEATFGEVLQNPNEMFEVTIPGDGGSFTEQYQGLNVLGQRATIEGFNPKDLNDATQALATHIRDYFQSH